MATSQDPSTIAESLAAWYETPLGQYVLEREHDYFDRVAADIFGYNALQFGLPQLDLLRTSRITSRWTPGHTAGHSRPPSTTDASTLVAVQGVGGVPFQPPVRS